MSKTIKVLMILAFILSVNPTVYAADKKTETKQEENTDKAQEKNKTSTAAGEVGNSVKETGKSFGDMIKSIFEGTKESVKEPIK